MLADYIRTLIGQGVIHGERLGRKNLAALTDSIDKKGNIRNPLALPLSLLILSALANLVYSTRILKLTVPLAVTVGELPEFIVILI